MIGEAGVEFFGYRHSEHSVSKEFEPFVAFGRSVGEFVEERTVSKREPEQAVIVEGYAEGLFERVGHWRRLVKRC